VTLVVAVTRRDSIWVVADRRLSKAGRPSKEDARKVMFLETTDGVAILGYAGLGATAQGTEPADWMSAVLRGRNLTLEQSLQVLADAMQRELPRHLIGMPGDGPSAHHVIVPAFLGKEPRLYTIDLVLAPDRRSYRFRYTRHVYKPQEAVSSTPWIAMGGSGVPYLLQVKTWKRSLLQVVRANDRGVVSARGVANRLAKLNNDVHLAATDKSDNSVGPHCIVAWRFRKNGVHKGGGAHEFYTGEKRDTSSQPSPIPSIANGRDMSAFLEVLAPYMLKQILALRAGERAQELDNDEINAALARLPDKPDEKLR